MKVNFPNLRASEAAYLLPALEAINVSQLEAWAAEGAPIPSVIEDLRSGVLKYIRRDEREEWRTIREIYQRGGGDCEDLAAAVAAEFRFWGFNSHSFPYPTRIPGLVHVIVWLEGQGDYLDPSRLGGMGSNAV